MFTIWFVSQEAQFKPTGSSTRSKKDSPFGLLQTEIIQLWWGGGGIPALEGKAQMSFSLMQREWWCLTAVIKGMLKYILLSFFLKKTYLQNIFSKRVASTYGESYLLCGRPLSPGFKTTHLYSWGKTLQWILNFSFRNIKERVSVLWGSIPEFFTFETC